MTLLQRFRFYKERNASPLAYWLARHKYVAGAYTVPEFLVLLWIGGVK